jgi:hypothetical protein
VVQEKEKEIGVRVRGANLASTGREDEKVEFTIFRSGLCGCGAEDLKYPKQMSAK